MHKIGQSRGFLDRLLGPLLKTSLLLMKNLLKPLAKSILIPSGLAAPVSATTTLIISNDEMNDIMKVIKSLEESGVS